MALFYFICISNRELKRTPGIGYMSPALRAHLHLQQRIETYRHYISPIVPFIEFFASQTENWNATSAIASASFLTILTASQTENWDHRGVSYLTYCLHILWHLKQRIETQWGAWPPPRLPIDHCISNRELKLRPHSAASPRLLHYPHLKQRIETRKLGGAPAPWSTTAWASQTENWNNKAASWLQRLLDITRHLKQRIETASAKTMILFLSTSS